MSTSIKFVMVLSALSVLGGCAANNAGTAARDPMSVIEMDRKMVAMGLLPPSVLEIDAELEKVSPDSPRALELRKQKLTVTLQQRDKLQAQEAAYRAVEATPQPEEQEQRMCSVNNGSSTNLVPC
ncbi:hypothetical protein [Pseudomonas marginalis]|uniref:hypothetical protein n=1 Tax=Pseudomonas marginalis TaxID=298 RepID=UPI0005FB000B|nr:hypothetical protein [Pseudomonas marginalis]KJZ52965.1 hypothetical protein VC37_17425 [Pseudomonas marginalis]KJZ54195.1 hypothetical protein VC36_25095 [Pseudomonas marginalis]